MKSKSLYISSHEKGAGSLIVSMGLMEFLKGTFLKVAFFRPFVEDCSCDWDINFFISRYNLDIQYDKSYGYSVQEAEKLIAQNRVTFLIEDLLEKYKQLEANYDFVIVEGLHQDAFSHALDIDINLEIAKNFGTLYCVILKGDGKSSVDLIDEILIESQVIKASGCGHFATFVNRLDETLIPKLSSNLQQYQLNAPVYLLAEIPELNMPTIADVEHNLDCTILLGEKKDFKRIVKQTKIAAMQLEHFLDHLEDGDLILFLQHHYQLQHHIELVLR